MEFYLPDNVGGALRDLRIFALELPIFGRGVHWPRIHHLKIEIQVPSECHMGALRSGGFAAYMHPDPWGRIDDVLDELSFIEVKMRYTKHVDYSCRLETLSVLLPRWYRRYQQELMLWYSTQEYSSLLLVLLPDPGSHFVRDGHAWYSIYR